MTLKVEPDENSSTTTGTSHFPVLVVGAGQSA